MSIPRQVRYQLRQRADWYCEICGLNRGTNAHHRKNRSQGGKDELSNLLLLCGSGTTGCHGYVTEHPAESYEKGWSVRSTATPRDIPVWYRCRWIWLDDFGHLAEAA